MAVVLVVAASVLATFVLITLALSVVYWRCRGRLTDWAERRLLEISGPAVVGAMSPETVLRVLLSKLFGGQINEIIAALLGGGGHDVAGRDVAVSRLTTAHAAISRIDEAICSTRFTWSHEFGGVRQNHQLVMFATSNPDIFNLLTSQRIYPLFESWLLPGDDQLEDFVPGIEVGISYRDEDGYVYTVDPAAEHIHEVALRDYGEYIRLPDRLDRQQLRIFQVDLYDLADPDHVIETIERLTLRASTIGAFEQGFVSWSPPYPCYVDVIVLDVRNLPRWDERLSYQIHLYSARLVDPANPVRGVWTHIEDEVKVPVRSWMLPGHGVTLLWRLDGTEPPDAPQRH